MAEKRQGRVEVLQTRLRGDGMLEVWATLDARDAEAGREYDWELYYLIRKSTAGGDIIELRVTPAPADTGSSWAAGTATSGGIPMKLLRLSSRDLTEVAAEFTGEMLAVMSVPDAREQLQSWARDFVARPRPGRKGRALVEYARIAQRYVELLPEPTPTAALARELGLSESQVRGVLYEARRRELLSDAPRGRAGGNLTELAIEILEQGD